MLNKRILAIGILFVLFSISVIPTITGAKSSDQTMVGAKRILPSYFFSRIEGKVSPDPRYSYNPLVNLWFTFDSSSLKMTPLFRPDSPECTGSGTFCAYMFIGTMENVTSGDNSSVYIKGIALGLIGIRS